MSRPLRIDYPGVWHHVMNRSRRGTRLYLDNEGYELFGYRRKAGQFEPVEESLSAR